MNDVVRRGLARHLTAVREGRVAQPRLGWKVAFNAPAVQKRLGLDGALVAGLGAGTRLDAPARFAVPSGSRVAVEAEVFVELGRDVDPSAGAGEAAAAVTAWGAAIEVVELDRPFDQLEEILAEGVFHRGVAFGATTHVSGLPELGGRRARATLAGEPVCDVDAGAATGRPGEVLLHVARTLAPFGHALCAGDVVILGAMNPLTLAPPSRRFEVTLDGAGEVAVDLAG